MQADEEAMREVIANRGDGETVKLTNSQEALRLERGMVEEEAKLEVAKAVLASKHYTFTSKTPGTSQPRPPADSRIRLGKRTASDVQAYDGVIPSSPSC